MTLLELVQDVILAILGYSMYVILCRMYTGIFVKKKQFKNKLYEYALVAGNILVLFTNLLVLGNMIPVKLLFMFLYSFLFMWLSYEHEFLKIFFSVLIHFMMVIVLDYVWPIALSLFIPFITWEVVYNTVAGPIMSVTSHFIHLGIFIFIKKWVLGKYSSGLSKGEWIYFSIFPIVTIAVFTMINVVFGFVENDIQKKIVTILSLGLLAMNIAMFLLIKNILKREAKIRESNLFLERVKNETERYRNISKNYAMQRKREHEYKNQMAIITALAREHKIEELNRYLKEYHKETIVKMNVMDTNNVIINAIINSKYQEAKEKDIVFVVKINDLSGIKLKDEDVVLILSNLLNNAIEACENCKDGTIRLKFVKERENILISVTNTITRKPVVVDNIYLTTKTENRESHGIGIDNIKETVESYGGECVVWHDEQFFHFTIYIPD